ncbi:MAG: MalM family protein [Alphaproteobacteria bacterium]|nr:MalM family protein [Alphaproteobacteria bacterium]
MRRLAALLVLCLAGCVPPPPDLPPLLDIGARSCPDTPSADAAGAAIILPDGKLSFADVDAGSPCLKTPEGLSLYTAFRFAPGGAPAAVAVASVAQGRTLMAPRVYVLDDAGRVVREIGADSFLFRGGMLATLLRLRPDDAAIVVASFPPVIGRDVNRIQSRVQVNSAVVGNGVFVWTSGSEAAAHHTLAHNGRIRIELYKLPP